MGRGPHLPAWTPGTRRRALGTQGRGRSPGRTRAAAISRTRRVRRRSGAEAGEPAAGRAGGRGRPLVLETWAGVQVSRARGGALLAASEVGGRRRAAPGDWGVRGWGGGPASRPAVESASRNCQMNEQGPAREGCCGCEGPGRLRAGPERGAPACLCPRPLPAMSF